MIRHKRPAAERICAGILALLAVGCDGAAPAPARGVAEQQTALLEQPKALQQG